MNRLFGSYLEWHHSDHVPSEAGRQVKKMYPDCSVCIVNGQAEEGDLSRFRLTVQFIEQFAGRKLHLSEDALKHFRVKDDMAVTRNRYAPPCGVFADLMATA